jgi:hypothetical protein
MNHSDDGDDTVNRPATTTRDDHCMLTFNGGRRRNDVFILIVIVIESGIGLHWFVRVGSSLSLSLSLSTHGVGRTQTGDETDEVALGVGVHVCVSMGGVHPADDRRIRTWRNKRRRVDGNERIRTHAGRRGRWWAHPFPPIK